ncbi:MAG: hypothetical protein HYY25_17440 [Candidatus Wallbacteria bacterium]|nr:hypothetical protein [Candidatus Wallbacteria bacterium]
MRKRGYAANPVVVQGQDLRGTFWGDNWRTNLESSTELAALLPSALEYLRNDLLVDLKIEAGQISALVQGAELYTVKIEVPAMPGSDWHEIIRVCEGQVGSVVELLAAAPASVVFALTQKPGGLYPSLSELTLSCSCAEWAGNCKHVTAALCGAGVRLDAHPDLLFRLRQVDPSDLVMHPEEPKEAPPAEETPELEQAALQIEEPLSSPQLALVLEEPLLPLQAAVAVAEQASPPQAAHFSEEQASSAPPAKAIEELAPLPQPAVVATEESTAVEETDEANPAPQAAEASMAAPTEELPAPVVTAIASVPASEGETGRAIPAVRPVSRADRKAKATKPIPRTPLPRVRGWRSQTTTMELLLDAGLSTSELRDWLADGTLILTDQATVYYTTPRAEMLLERLAPKPARRQAR